MRFQIRELLTHPLVIILINEAPRKELIRTIVVFGVALDGLLRHRYHVAGGDVAAVAEGEGFEDFALDGYYTCISYSISDVGIWG